MKTRPRKKVRPKISKDAGARNEISFDRLMEVKKGWVAAGFDLSPAGIAGCALGYDEVLKKSFGPVFTVWRWESDVHYFDRIKDCARAENYIQSLLAQAKVLIPSDFVFIAIEEPFPMGMWKQMESTALKQQAEISGAFLAGLLRYGYDNIFQIHNTWWRQIVAEELGITIHHSKWSYEHNPFDLAPHGKGSGKWRAKEYGLKFGLPDWPDLIKHKTGKIPRPEGSTARGVQPDDRYDAFPIAKWMEAEYLRGSVDNQPRDDSLREQSRKGRRKYGAKKK